MKLGTGAYQRPHLHAVNGHGNSPRATLRSWARWNDELSQRYTVGVEEELMLLDPHTWALVQSSDEVIARLSEELSAYTSPETHASVIELESEPSSAMPSPEVLGENRFLAARDGMDARLIDPESRCLVPAREMLDSLLADCWEPALSLGCAGALDRVPRLAAANGAERQHALVATSGHLDRLVPTLADHFVAPHSRTTTAATNLHTSVNPTERSGICAAGSHTQAPPS